MKFFMECAIVAAWTIGGILSVVLIMSFLFGGCLNTDMHVISAIEATGVYECRDWRIVGHVEQKTHGWVKE